MTTEDGGDGPCFEIMMDLEPEGYDFRSRRWRVSKSSRKRKQGERTFSNILHTIDSEFRKKPARRLKGMRSGGVKVRKAERKVRGLL